MQKYLRTLVLFGLGYLFVNTMVMVMGWHTYMLPNKGVYEAIRRSRSEQKTTKLLIIGDSVAKQIFEERNEEDTITSLACNQSIDLVGHYLLLKNFLFRNPTVERIAFIYNPFSFNNDLDHKYTYNYFLKPFYNSKYTSDFSPHIRDRIATIPYAEWVNFPLIATSFWTPDFEYGNRGQIFLSETSREYLQKIDDLARAKGIPITLIAAPIKASRKEEVEQLRQYYLANGSPLSILENYFENIRYLPDELYMDDIHFYDPEKIRATAEKQFYGRSN